MVRSNAANSSGDESTASTKSKKKLITTKRKIEQKSTHSREDFMKNKTLKAKEKPQSQKTATKSTLQKNTTEDSMAAITRGLDVIKNKNDTSTEVANTDPSGLTDISMETDTSNIQRINNKSISPGTIDDKLCTGGGIIKQPTQKLPPKTPIKKKTLYHNTQTNIEKRKRTKTEENRNNS